MRTGLVLRQERERHGWTQDELAARLRCSPGAICNYENDYRKIPDDILAKTVRILNSPRLAVQRCFECEAGLFKAPPLDMVDQHPVTVRDKLLEEAEEVIDGLRTLDLINKRTQMHLTQEDRQDIERVLGQMADLIPAIQTFMTVMATAYDFDLHRIFQGLYRKLEARHYIAGKENGALESAYSRSETTKTILPPGMHPGKGGGATA